MAETLFKRWESYHSGNDHRNDRCDHIKNTCSKELFEAYKKKAGFLYFSADNLLEKMSEQLPGGSTGYALFSSESCLLKLYGSASFLQWCQERSIIPGMIWDTKRIGVAIHFCPISHHDPVETHGAIAILAPQDLDSPYLPLLCYANAREISLYTFWNEASLQSSRRAKKPVSHHPRSGVNYSFADLLTKNKQFDDMLHYAKAASSSESSILLLGESGSGKDVIAQAIHRESPRKDKPFVALNCAAFSKELISSELFGYEEGSFTGAAKGGTMGKFELANNGTLFLDEIGDMPLDLQTTLLRVLETKSFMKVGGNKLIQVDVRIIAATNQDLREKIQKKLFREDLYYRLGVIRFTVPPLRERKEDIIPLAKYFVGTICKQIGKGPFILDAKAKEFLESYTWPGNIRELKNMVEGIINIYNGPVIELSQIAGYLCNNVNDSTPHMLQRNSASCRTPAGVRPTKEDITAALLKTRGNKVETAKTLGISRRTLYRRLVEFGLL